MHSELDELFRCFLILYRVTTVYLLILFSWKVALFWIPVWWSMPGHDWKGGVIYSPTGLVNMKSQAALGLKLFFWKTVLRKQHCFLPHSGPQSLRFMENSVHWLSARVECAKAWVSFLLPPYPGSPGHIPVCGHHSAEVAVICRWGDPKDGGWR